MTRWEYHFVLREREFASGKAQRWDVEIGKALAELGEQGWELVSVTARCDRVAPVLGAVPMYGADSHDLWVFTRPKAESQFPTD